MSSTIADGAHNTQIARPPHRETPYTIGYVMSQVAGHVTNYRNLRSVAETDPTLRNVWHEVAYFRDGGALERLRARLPFIPPYATGVLRSLYEVRRALHSQRYDAVLCNAKVGVFFSREFRRTPTLIDFDATPRQIDRMPAYGISNDPPPVARLKWQLAHDMMHAAAKVQVWSQWARNSAIEEYGVPGARIVVNPPGVNLDFWQTAPVAVPRTPGQPRRILFVGGDFRRKGGPLLLDWYKTQDPADYTLHIVTREAVDAPPGVHIYHDMQPNTPALLRLYHDSDLFVLPSLGECFGIATVEAMGVGLPVIASDVGGIADIIEPARNGFIVPSNDVRALGAAIAAVFSSDSRPATMGRESRALAEERFDVQINARRTLGYLKEIATF